MKEQIYRRKDCFIFEPLERRRPDFKEASFWRMCGELVFLVSVFVGVILFYAALEG